MATLPTHVKYFIVQELACFRAPSKVAHDVTTAFGLQIDRRQVWKYTPAHNPRLAPRWRAIFAATRSTYLRDIEVRSPGNSLSSSPPTKTREEPCSTPGPEPSWQRRSRW